MTTPTNPTERPWAHTGAVYGDYGTRHEEIVDAVGLVVCGEFGGPDAEQAALIVRAVNAHDDLVEALNIARKEIEWWADGVSGNENAAYAAIDAALAKATGDE